MIGVQKWTRLTDDPATTEKEGWWKVDCPAPGSQSQSQPQGNTVSFANFQDVLARASASLFSDNPLLTDAELKDLGDLYSSSPPNTIDLSGTGALSGEKLIYIYNKVK